LLRTDAIEAGVRTLSDVAGLTVANTADVEGGALDATMLTSGNAIVFDKLAVAVVDTPPEQIHMLGAASAEESGILAIEPERVVYALAEAWPTTVAAPTTNGPSAPPVTLPSPVAASNGSLPVEYLSGYRDAVDHLVDRVLATAGVAARATPEAVAALDESVLTWGLQVTKVAESRFTGKGVRVAVLDTGFDVGHPDFAGRRIVTQSFVPGQDVQDGHGHGTHCIGTSMGPKQPGQLPRYGIAYEADIYAGKVLSNQGSGTDSGILAGINWAITNRCAVVSMSLGAAVLPGQGFSRVFEAVARRALAAGTLIVAAAGNESHRPDFIKPVGHPANCPSIMAIAAIDSQLQVTYFSSAGINPQGGQVDIAAPGLQVRSSWPRPTLYRTISGTSMATPHVAGIAALHAEANPDVRGGALGWLLLQSARRLDLSTQDIGAGLVQAP
jgi:subtilisin family serine protease